MASFGAIPHTSLVLVQALAMISAGALLQAEEISTFPAYVDSDLCSRLLLGPITPDRVACSEKTYKEGSNAVVVRLRDNLVLNVNKEKVIKPFVGKLAEVSGELKVKDGKIKLQDAKPFEASTLASGDPSRKLLDVRTSRTATSAKLYEQIRHELAMMPYLTEFDFISFSLSGDAVILTGWTVRITNRSTAYNLIKNIEGVATIINNIEVLPMGSSDMQIRAGARAALQRYIPRYFWGSGSDVKIVVKNGDIILLGTVATKADSDLAYMQCNSVRGAFKVFNMLRVQSETSSKKG
jgi:osmotically-inducible protein OsmY